MTAARFSWGIDENSDCLRIRVDRGERSVSWKLPGQGPSRLARMLREVADELDPAGRKPAPLRETRRALVKPEQPPEVSQDEQQTEEDSQAALAAKAAQVSKPGGVWFSNMTEDTELPLYDIGHGGGP